MQPTLHVRTDGCTRCLRFCHGRVGEYKVLKVLGAGSFAQVAVGEHEKTGEKVSHTCIGIFPSCLILSSCLFFDSNAFLVASGLFC